MRQTIALVGIILVGSFCHEAVGDETGNKWWPFGQEDEAELASPFGSPQSAVTTAPPVASDSFAASGPPAMASEQSPLPPLTPDEESEQSWMIKSPFANVSWPRLRMPEMPKPSWSSSPRESEAEAPRNTWMERTPEPPKPSPLQAMKDGARRVGQSTREAWDKTVDAVTPDDKTDRSSRVARRPKQPSVWKRMFGANNAKANGSQTMPQFIAQDRPE